MPDSMPAGNVTHLRSGTLNIANTRRVLVLGASGFIGRHLLERLASSEWARPVAASYRRSLDLPFPVETAQFDARTPNAMQDALRGVAGVVNCITGDSATIINSAQALFAACSRMTPMPRIVNLSTMMVYGTATGLLDETARLIGDWDDYSAAKVAVEQMSRVYESVVHLRPGIVYGPRSPIWSGRIGRWLCQHRLGDLGAAGNGFCNLVHVDDVVLAVEQALQLPGIDREAFNLSLPSPPTWNEYFRAFSAALGTTVGPISRARLMLERYIIAPPLKVAEILSPRLPFAWRPPDPIRPWLLRLCGHAVRLDVRKAEHVLGINWTPLDQGIQKSAEWVLAGNKAGIA